jgi:glycosyltransferase involved in cell wall biosynthesis
MRVVYINKYASLDKESPGTHRSLHLMKGLSEFGVEVFFMFANSHNVYPNTDHFVSDKLETNFKAFPIKAPNFRKSESFSRFWSWMIFELKITKLLIFKIKRADFVIASSPSFLSLVNGLVTSKFLKAKFVAEIRDIWPLTLIELGRFSKKNPLMVLMNRIESFIYNHSDLIIGTMPNLQSHVQKRSKRCVPVHTIPMGYDDSVLQSLDLKTDLFTIHADLKNKFTILYAGSIGVSNELQTFLQVAQVFIEDNSVQFIVLGSGDQKKQLLEIDSKTQSVIFIDRVSRTEALSIMSSASVLYFAAENSEIWKYGQSMNKIVDYMLSGRPILGSYSGYLTMINEASCGIVVPSENQEALIDAIKVLKSLSDEQLYEMGNRGRTWIIANRNYYDLSKRYLHLLNGLN